MGNTCVSVVLHYHENISCYFLAFSFYSLVKQNSFFIREFNSILFVLRVVQFIGTKHAVRKWQFVPTFSPKYAITLSLSCPVIVYLNRGKIKNGPGQFNFSGLFLFRPQAAFIMLCFSFSLYFIDVFSTHPLFELCSPAHIDTFWAALWKTVKTVWI